MKCGQCGKEWVCTCDSAPDPQAGDGKIVKLVRKKLNDSLYLPEYEEIARAIEAQIEAVRKLFRNHEERLSDIPALWENDDTHGNKMCSLERKVKELDREVGQAHERCHNHWKYLHPLAKKAGLFENDQPQPASPEQSRGVVRCKDEKEEERVLRPGRSVVEFQFASGNKEVFLFRHTADEGRDLYGYPASHIHIQSTLTCYRAKFCIWLCDLDFPPGGDK